jgi:GTPase SAR1 family protein/flagellar motor switch/type III secretory pathway protein FliN
MALINHATRELTAKIVYYGPGLCGKTTNLKYIYESLEEEQRGPMLSLSTESDRTLFFDFLPLDLGEVKGFRVRVQLYTVPGQVFYEETRRRVLKGADGVVFVADSQRSLAEANRDSFTQLLRHLGENGIDASRLPLVLQYNKRDLKEIASVDELDRDLNPGSVPFFEAVASVGIGVEDTFRAISRLVLKKLVSSGLEGEAPLEKEERAGGPFALRHPASAEELFEAEAEAALVLGEDPEPQSLFGESATDERALLESDPFFSEASSEEDGLAEALFGSSSGPEEIAPAAPESGSAPEAAGAPLQEDLKAVPGVPLELSLEIGGKRYRLKILLEVDQDS